MCEVGGIVVYSTCSLTREQNEDVVAAFLAKYGDRACLEDLPLDPMTPLSSRTFAAEYPGIPSMCRVRRFDETTGTSGLFIARFLKKA